MDGERQNVREIVQFGRYDLDGKLVEVIDRLQQALAEVPEEFRSAVEMDVSADEYSVDVSITYWRPETDAEYEERRRTQAQSAAWKAHLERAEYERLKAKFGP